MPDGPCHQRGRGRPSSQNVVFVARGTVSRGKNLTDLGEIPRVAPWDHEPPKVSTLVANRISG